MRCPICGQHGAVGKLFEVVRGNKSVSSYFCNCCSVEFRAQGDKVLAISKVKANGNIKKIC